MSEKETCFVFYQRWYTQISLLPEQDQLQLFKAICDYVFCGTKAELNVYLEAIMVNIRMSIDKDRDKHEAFIEQRKKAIQARWDKYQKECNTGNTSVYERIQPNTSEQFRNTNLYNNKNKNKNKEQELKQEQELVINDKSKICLSNPRFDENGNEIKNEDNPSSENGQEGNTGQEITEEEKKQLEEEQKQKEKEKRLREEEKKKKAFARMIVDFFNAKVQENKSSLKPVVILTKKRIEHITARANDFCQDAEANIKKAIVNATTAPYLNGANKYGWMATFDWIFLPNNFPKVLEGHYNNKLIPTSNGTNDKQNAQTNNGLLSDRQRRDLEFAQHAAELLKAADTTAEEIQKPLW